MYINVLMHIQCSYIVCVMAAFFSLSLSLSLSVQAIRTGLEKGPVEGYEAESKVHVHVYELRFIIHVHVHVHVHVQA